MIVVTGAAHVVLGGEGGPSGCDPTPWLKERKSRKYMGLQDEMSVFCAGGALASAGLWGATARLGARAGLYLSVGYIPFEEKDARAVLDGSVDEAGRFSVERFAAEGRHRAHPLLTFRCLPNMPAFHVSSNFGIEGPYLVTYPGPAQTYLALEEARIALESGQIDVALLGAVAHQRNFLVEHHAARLAPAPAREALRDAAAVLVLERRDDALSRGAAPRAELGLLAIEYAAFDPRIDMPAPAASTEGGAARLEALDLGAAAMPALLSEALGARAEGPFRFEHSVRTRDGYTCTSAWGSP